MDEIWYSHCSEILNLEQDVKSVPGSSCDNWEMSFPLSPHLLSAVAHQLASLILGFCYVSDGSGILELQKRNQESPILHLSLNSYTVVDIFVCFLRSLSPVMLAS